MILNKELPQSLAQANYKGKHTISTILSRALKYNTENDNAAVEHNEY